MSCEKFMDIKAVHMKSCFLFSHARDTFLSMVFSFLSMDHIRKLQNFLKFSAPSWSHLITPAVTPFPIQMENSLLIFLKVSLDASYFLCICPFRVSINRGENGRIKAVSTTWAPQHIMCTSLTILGLFWIIGDLRTALPTNLQNPSLYFRMLLKFDVSISKFLLLKMFWFNRPDIVNIFNFVANSIVLPVFIESRKFFTEKIIAILICSLYTGNALIEVITGYYTGSSLGGVRHSQWNVRWWWGAMIEAGRFNYFLDTFNPSSNQTNFEVNKWALGDHMVGLLSTLGFFQR